MITIQKTLRARLAVRYEMFHVIYETTRNPEDRADAARHLIAIRTTLGLAHEDLLALAESS